MEFKDSDQVRAVTFRSGYPAIKKKTESTFYQLIAGGDKVQLLNYVSKEIRENYTYMGYKILILTKLRCLKHYRLLPKLYTSLQIAKIINLNPGKK